MVPCDRCEPQSMRLEAVNGSSISVIGALNTGVLLNGICMSVNFLVSRDINEPMLGMSFLNQNECYWDFKRGTLFVDGKELKLFTGESKPKCRRVIPTQTISPPPRSQNIVEVVSPVLDLTQPCPDGILESSQLGNGLTLARTVVPEKECSATTCHLNTSEESHTLSEGRLLGCLEPVEVLPDTAERVFPSPVSAALRSVTEETWPKSSEPSPPRIADNARIDEVREVITNFPCSLPDELTPEQREVVENLLWPNLDNEPSTDDDDIIAQRRAVTHGNAQQSETTDDEPFAVHTMRQAQLGDPNLKPIFMLL